MEFLLKKSQEFGLDYTVSSMNGKPVLHSEKNGCSFRETKYSQTNGLTYKIYVGAAIVKISQYDFDNMGDYYRSLFTAVAVIAKTLNDLKP